MCKKKNKKKKLRKNFEKKFEEGQTQKRGPDSGGG